MKTPEQVVVDVTRRLHRTWAVALAGTSGGLSSSQDSSDVGWPHAFPIGQPTGTALAGDFPAVAAAAARWRSWAVEAPVTLRTRTRRVHGTDQTLPTHVEVDDVDAAAALAGVEWVKRLARARSRLAVLDARYPRLRADVFTVPSVLRAVDSYSDLDFDVACRAADWFTSHGEVVAAGLTPRQVPVAGVHAKWLNTRQSVVATLAGRTSLGLLPRHPARIHFTYLDPDHRASGGRLHDSATVGDAVVLPYRPRVVLISENKDTALHFPPVPGGVSVEGMGRGGATAAAFDWLTSAPRLFYWGDMDSDGLEILDGFRASGVSATSLLMGTAAYEAWQRFGTDHDPSGRLLTAREPRPVPHLNVDEAALYARLTSTDPGGHRRVEQERIPLQVAHAKLLAHL